MCLAGQTVAVSGVRFGSPSSACAGAGYQIDGENRGFRERGFVVPRSYAPEFRRRVVELVRLGRAVSVVAAEMRPCRFPHSAMSGTSGATRVGAAAASCRCS